MDTVSFFRFDTFDAERAVTSYLFKSKGLIITRVIGTVYLLAVLVGALATTPSLRIVVPLVYWTLLRSHQKPHTGVYEWATISEHSMDGVFMIVEIVSTRMLMDIRHLPFTLTFMVLYLLVTFVNWWTTHTWVYSFLDYVSQGWTKTVMYYISVAVGLIIVYLAMWKIHDLKEHLGLRRCAGSRNQENLKVNNDLSSVCTQVGEEKTVHAAGKDAADMV
ncbi:hypothetical protein BGX28_000096 [Mortierella sp. GBA30]|nr:hypothetical protein BGX28_000096 [Mortierella sp. GBA30]